MIAFIKIEATLQFSMADAQTALGIINTAVCDLSQRISGLKEVTLTEYDAQLGSIVRAVMRESDPHLEPMIQTSVIRQGEQVDAGTLVISVNPAYEAMLLNINGINNRH